MGSLCVAPISEPHQDLSVELGDLKTKARRASLIILLLLSIIIIILIIISSSSTAHPIRAVLPRRRGGATQLGSFERLSSLVVNLTAITIQSILTTLNITVILNTPNSKDIIGWQHPVSESRGAGFESGWLLEGSG